MASNSVRVSVSVRLSVCLSACLSRPQPHTPIRKCGAVPPYTSHESQNTGANSFFFRFGVFHSNFPYILREAMA